MTVTAQVLFFTHPTFINLDPILSPASSDFWMSREEALTEIVDKTFSLPPKVILGYAQLDQAFTSGDLARVCDISRSSAKFYLKKMVEIRLVTKVPHKRRYQKYANADTFSTWLKDLIKLAVAPIESGDLKLPEEE